MKFECARVSTQLYVGDNFLPIIGASTIVITNIYPLTTCLVPLGKKVKKNIFCVLYSTVNNIAIKFISPKLILFDISTLHHATNQEIEYFYIVLSQGPLKIWTEHSKFPLQGRGTQKPL